MLRGWVLELPCERRNLLGQEDLGWELTEARATIAEVSAQVPLLL